MSSPPLRLMSRARAAQPTNWPDALAAALERERDLLHSLLDVLQRQRHAVVTGDLQAVDDTVFATHRLLTTYREAQERRRQLTQLLCGPGDVTLGMLDRSLGVHMTDRLRRSRAEVRLAAEALRRDLAANRAHLERAVSDSALRGMARTVRRSSTPPAGARAVGSSAASGGPEPQADGDTSLDLSA